MLLNLMTYVLIPAYTLLFIKGSHYLIQIFLSMEICQAISWHFYYGEYW